MTKIEADDKSSERQKITITKFKAGVLIAGVIVCLVLVGLLAGLLRTCPCPQSTPEGPVERAVKAAAAAASDTNKTKTSGRSREILKDTDEEDFVWNSHRLPENVIPVHYDLVLYPDFYDGNNLFYGNVSIFINVTGKPTEYLLIHCLALKVEESKVRLVSGGGKEQEQELQIKRNFSYPARAYWVIQMREEIAVGSLVRVQMEFEGYLDRGLAGLYRSRYIDSRTGVERFLATSKFQPTDARRAFPCLDEPRFKTTFNVTLIHRPGYFALSNMPEEAVTNSTNGLLATRFQKSVPMVTYLACFIVCDFKYKESKTKSGVPIRIFSTPDKIDQVDYAVSISSRILEFYEDTFGLPYPLPKLDQIAIPDFSSGAMEHWGLVTYRESVLLYDDREASVFNKQRVAVVVAHELAHMWFGNLVTMNWWNDLWLNEGFASYVEYMGVNHVHPDWNMDSQFLTDDIQMVMSLDATVSSHPIVVPVDHPDQISEVFDSISYNKGASVLRMLEGFMGSEKFKKGLQFYMKKYQYQVTETNDLWNSLSQVEGAPDVSAVMDTWTMQMGYPVVDVEFDGDRVLLTQKRFLTDPRADPTLPPSKFNYTWQIPLLTIDSFGNSTLVWLKTKQGSFELPNGFLNGTNWIKLNARSASYVRINYPEKHWILLAEVLRKNPKALSSSDRSNLLDDSFSLAKAGLLSYRVPLELVKYIGQEDDYAPWKTFEGHAYYIREMMQYSEHFGKWKRYVIDLLERTLQQIRYDRNGSHIERMMRTPILSMSCVLGHRGCLNNISRIFDAWLHEDKYIVPSLRGVVYRYGMQVSGYQFEWEKLWHRYVNSTVAQEKNRILMGLAQAREAWLLHRLLTYAVDDSKIRSQDCFTAISCLVSSPLGRSLAWDWAVDNWPKLVAKFSLNNRYLGRMIPGIIQNFNTQFQLQEVESFFARYPSAGAGERGRNIALDTIRANIAWMDRNLKDIASWLENNGHVPN